MAAPFQIENPAGLWALLGLVPLIILYLIRPRPTVMAVPSLMFFLKSSGSRRLNSFLRQITHDWLFLIQLIALSALLLTFAHPYSTYEHDVTASNTVIVLDVSASMHTKEGRTTRFDLAIQQAKRVLGSKNSIILAKQTPYLALKDATAEETIRFLNSLRARDTPTHLGEAIILAGETLGSEGRVVVISDFVNTGGQNPDVAKAVLESKNIVVDFVNVGSDGKENTGIVKIDAANEETTIYVKNYNKKRKSVQLSIGASRTTLEIPPESTETYSFKTPPGTTKIKLETKDDLAEDNIAYLAAPKEGRTRVLLITNNESVFLKTALLASSDFAVTITEPPVVPKDYYDVYIINNIDPAQILPGTFEQIFDNVEKG
ncbi:VWA domain-containing protein, partial [Candidatus Woesearchaeota archaeon]